VTAAQRALDSAIEELNRLHKILRKSGSPQVRPDDERQLIKAISHAWFNNHRASLAETLGEGGVQEVDTTYQLLLAASNRATTRAKYLLWTKGLSKSLAQLQASHAVPLSAIPSASPPSVTNDALPQFFPLVADVNMQSILANRWRECVQCLDADAPLAATVMMGGILEGLLLARINALKDKRPVFTASTAPKDKIGATLKLNEWGLKNFIDVAHELQWISKTTRDIGEVVRDYRNYIHPQKEHSHGVTITVEDARMMWEVAKSVARQVLRP